MKTIFISIILLLSLPSLPASYAALDLETYVKRCEAELNIESWPSISCEKLSKPPILSLKNSQLEYHESKSPKTCLNPSFAGPKRCVVGSYMNGRFSIPSTKNEEIQVSINCARGSTTVIIENTVNGKVCFFENDETQPTIIGEEPGNWFRPIDYSDSSGFTCTHCHSPSLHLQTPKTNIRRIEGYFGKDDFKKTLAPEDNPVPINCDPKKKTYSIVAKDELESLHGKDSWTPKVILDEGLKTCSGSCHYLAPTHFNVRNSLNFFSICSTGNRELDSKLCSSLQVDALDELGTNLHEILFGVKVNLSEDLRKNLIELAEKCMFKKNIAQCQGIAFDSLTP